jgi:thiamine biosynthesis protein ThiC
VTPAEHLRLPTLDDVREGVIASKTRLRRSILPGIIPGR